jgi:hypothetical protein
MDRIGGKTKGIARVENADDCLQWITSCGAGPGGATDRGSLCRPLNRGCAPDTDDEPAVTIEVADLLAGICLVLSSQISLPRKVLHGPKWRMANRPKHPT